jgi:6,7-dimethyl-8-ribityllumazine synthase
VRFALVVSTYHDFVTARLADGARAELRESGVADADIVAINVPGAFEIAQAAYRLASSGGWDAVVCLGCLIRGETPHFDYIARATADGIMRAAQETNVPVTFGVLTTNTAEEAMARAGDGDTNKGREAARAAFSMARLYAELSRAGSAGATPARPAGARTDHE